MVPKRRDHLRFEDLFLITMPFSQIFVVKLTTAISFSRQIDTGSRARNLCLLETLALLLLLEPQDL